MMTKPVGSTAQKDCPQSAASSGGERAATLAAGLLAELRMALADQGIHSELRQDVPCLAVPMKAEPYRLWIFVTSGGRYFSWNNAQLQHPVFDMQGAVRRIAAQLHGQVEEGAT